MLVEVNTLKDIPKTKMLYSFRYYLVGIAKTGKEARKIEDRYDAWLAKKGTLYGVSTSSVKYYVKSVGSTRWAVYSPRKMRG